MIETRFKDTEVGRIPEDWEVKALGDVLSVGNGRDYKHLSFGDIPVYGTGGYMTSVSDYLYDGETVCIGRKGTIDEPQYHTGKIWTVDTLFYTYGFQNVCVKYLFYLFNRIDWKKYNEATGVPSLTSKNILAIIAQFPKLSEQIRIATALSNIDALISELGRQIEKKRAIKQGAMQQLLTGKKRLKGFSEPWVEKKLGEVGVLTKQSVNPQMFPNTLFSEYSMPAFDNGQSPDFKYGNEMFSNRTVIDGETLLYNKLNVRQNRIWLVKECGQDSICSAEFLAFKSNDIYLDLLKYILSTNRVTKDFIDMSKGTSNSQKRIQPADFLNYSIYFPKSGIEQKAIASVLTSMDDEITALEAKKAKYEQIKQGMMQQLLTGKIRLVNTIAKTNTTSANVHFRRSVFAAEIADRLCEEPTFGHVKMEKMLFLTESICHIDIGSHYHRDVAGPYDPRALRSIDSQLKKQKWFEVRRTEKGNRYVPMQNRGKHKIYFSRYYSTVLPTFEKIIDTFKTQNTERCEIVATLYSAWEDLLHSNKPFTDADIVNEVLNNWHESKKRISKERWLSAIQWMRENGFAPIY